MKSTYASEMNFFEERNKEKSENGQIENRSTLVH